MKAIPLVHASVVRMNSFCMLGKDEIGADVRALLRKSNYCSWTEFHTNLASRCNNLRRLAVLIEKFLTKRR